MEKPYLEPGERLADSYAIRGELARRGSHRLYEADDLVLGRTVAIEISEDATALRREAKALAQVRTPAVPAVYGLGWHRGLGYLALERITGSTLAELIDAPGWRHLGEVVATITPLAEALAAIHAAGMAHGALTAGSVIRCADERVVISDFGAVVAPPTAAPDDVRAFAALTYQLFIGEPPAGRADVAALRPDVPFSLADLLQACLAPEPRDRPSIDDVADHLRALPRRRHRASTPHRALGA